MYNWVTLLYSRNENDIVNQLYFNKKFKTREKRPPEGFPSVLLLTLIGGYMGVFFYLLKCTVAQLCDYTKHHWIVYIKGVNCIVVNYILSWVF